MEKKTNNLNKIVYIIFFITLLTILIFTTYKLNKRHEEKLYDVLYSEIEYAANKCYLKKECENNITLKDLYDKEYLDTMYDPISKEELNSSLKIIIKENKIIIKKK